MLLEHNLTYFDIVHCVQYSIRLIIKNQQSMINCALHVWRVASNVTNILRFFFYFYVYTVHIE